MREGGSYEVKKGGRPKRVGFTKNPEPGVRQKAPKPAAPEAAPAEEGSGKSGGKTKAEG